ncbi:hypothetical protein V1523DRAFT_422115 [Lipomyces doorenjongii]
MSNSTALFRPPEPPFYTLIDSITRFAIMSATSTSSATEKVNGTALADVVEEPEGKGDAEQAKEPVDTADDVGVYPNGFRLAMVVLALVLAVFLVALDLVS